MTASDRLSGAQSAIAAARAAAKADLHRIAATLEAATREFGGFDTEAFLDYAETGLSDGLFPSTEWLDGLTHAADYEAMRERAGDLADHRSRS